MKHARKVKQAWILVVLVVASWSRAEAAPYFDDTVKDQWFTGSLESPSPALTKAGVVAVEPYAIYTGNTGAYNNAWGHYSVPNDVNQMQSLTLLKYGITDRLSIQAVPTFNYAWNGLTTSNGVGWSAISRLSSNIDSTMKAAKLAYPRSHSVSPRPFQPAPITT